MTYKWRIKKLLAEIAGLTVRCEVEIHKSGTGPLNDSFHTHMKELEQKFDLLQATYEEGE